ncbi:MAG: hypothetical protein HFJ30_03145 [Clostridia bacterium]|nr:hypothetical protein [Clostridia bacterium]MCI9413285.1 hypothetical protein [Clostridia bacterium]
MAYTARRAGYQYETSPRKLKPEYEPLKNPYSKKKSSTLKQKEQKPKEKRQLKPKVKIVLYVLIGFGILFAISYRNSLITESFSKKENMKKELSVLQKENAQLKINIQNSLNLANVEKSATAMLGMKKLDDSQKIYVNLPKKDYVEPASEQIIVTEEKGWFQKMIEGVTSLFK